LLLKCAINFNATPIIPSAMKISANFIYNIFEMSFINCSIGFQKQDRARLEFIQIHNGRINIPQ